MGEELKALEASGICELIKRPEQVNALHTKWMFKTKTDANDNIERFKARQVGCGNKHVSCGVDCGLTFTAVMDISTVEVIMAHVVMCQAWIKATTRLWSQLLRTRLTKAGFVQCLADIYSSLSALLTSSCGESLSVTLRLQ